MSPKLFSAVLEEVFWNLNLENKFGIKINGRKISYLRFTDDTVLFTKSAKGFETMLRNLCNQRKTAVLAIYGSQTMLMPNHEEIEVNEKMT